MSAPAWLRWAAAQFAVVLAVAWALASWDNSLAQRLLPVLVVLAAALFAAVIVCQRPARTRPLPPLLTAALVGGAVAAGWGLRAWANRGHPLPLGYDYGFYKAAFDLHEGQVPLDRAPHWVQLQFEPGLPALHSMLHAVAGLDSADHLLHLFPLLASFLVVPAFAAARGRFGDGAGIVAAWIVAVSATQFEAFAYLYEKNVLAIALLFVLVLLVQRQSWVAAGLVLGGLAIWHRPTFLLAVLASPVAFLPRLRTSWRPLAWGAAVAAAVALPVWLALGDTFFATGTDVAAQAATSSPTQPSSTGTFFSLTEYLVRAAAYAPLAFAGVILAWKRPAARLPVALLVLTGLYVVLRLPLHLRFIVMLDAVAALLVAGTLGRLLAGRNALAVACATFVVCAAAVPAVMEAADPSVAHRYVTPEQARDLRWLQDLPAGTVLVTDNLRAPYVAAASGHPTFGPGLFDDPHTRAQWGAFWGGLDEAGARGFLAPYGDGVHIVQILEAGPEWGSSTVQEPTFEVVHATSSIVVWRLAPEDAP